MDNSWVTQIEENVATYIDAELNETMDILVTTEDFTGDTAGFPAVYVHEMSQSEKGYDIDGSSINGVTSTFEINTYAQTSSECKGLGTKVMLLMKDMRFEVIASPLKTQEYGYFRTVARYRRIFGGEDRDLIDNKEIWD